MTWISLPKSPRRAILRNIVKRTLPKPTSPHCDWTAYYDLIEDDSISFYSHENVHSLGTTFRSVPDPNPSQSNNTVLRILNLKIKASSRLFLVKSPTARNHKSPGIANGTLRERKSPSITNIGYFRGAMQYLDARRRLGRFRKYHSHLQEEETGRVVIDLGEKKRPLDFWKPDILICNLYLIVWGARWTCPPATSRQAARTLSMMGGGFFLLCHLFSYYILETKTLHSSRAAGLVRLYSLTEYVIRRL
jgi:hypothetical protein